MLIEVPVPWQLPGLVFSPSGPHHLLLQVMPNVFSPANLTPVLHSSSLHLSSVLGRASSLLWLFSPWPYGATAFQVFSWLRASGTLCRRVTPAKGLVVSVPRPRSRVRLSQPASFRLPWV